MSAKRERTLRKPARPRLFWAVFAVSALTSLGTGLALLLKA